jgi:hypothetical protein
MRLFVGVWLWAGSTHVNYVIAIERLLLWERFEGENVPGTPGVTLGKQFYKTLPLLEYGDKVLEGVHSLNHVVWCPLPRRRAAEPALAPEEVTVLCYASA